jgi:hypothetical protein
MGDDLAKSDCSDKIVVPGTYSAIQPKLHPEGL